MQYGIAFTPLVPSLVLWLALAAIAVIAALLLLGRTRGAAVRVTALALIVLALANPSFTREDREPLSSVAAVVIDKSPSQNFGERTRETREAQEALVDSLKKIKGLEVRVVEAGQADGETDGTRLFGALSSALSDVPIDRVAGAFLITDGRVHDIPPNAAALGFQAPVHALITGRKDERDRRIAIVAAPRFGIVGQVQTITYRLDDQGVSGERAKVAVRRDGETISERTVLSGQTVNVDIDIKHAGPNIVEIEASPGDSAASQTPGMLALRNILSSLDVPELEPVPREHVLTKTFYLLRDFPGRFDTGQTWVETLPRDDDEDTASHPARGGDGVSPIIITSNDLAGAWAIRPDGQPMLPLSPGEPRQREFAFRAGVNIVMYTLTGNYKADQVHAPALIERLGQ